MTHELTFHELVVESQYLLKWQKHPVLSQLNPSSDVIIVESPKCDKCVWSESERESERKGKGIGRGG